MDSSAWLAYYFAGSIEAKEIVEGESTLITSTLSLFEIKKRLLSLHKNPQEFLEFIKQRSGLIVPDIEIVEKAAALAIEKKLAAMDALLYTTSVLHKAEFITGDNDFRGLEQVRIIS